MFAVFLLICSVFSMHYLEFEKIYGAGFNLDVVPGQDHMYPSYTERYIHHMFNIVRMDCVSAYTNSYVSIPQSVCDMFSSGGVFVPRIPYYYSPELAAIGCSQSYDCCCGGKCGLQHNSCDGTPAGTRVNNYLTQEGVGASYGGEVGAMGYSYTSVTAGWLCEGSYSQCKDGGHRQAIMSTGKVTVGLGHYSSYIFGDWMNKAYNRDRRPIYSSTTKSVSGNLRFMTAFYHVDSDGMTVNGFVVISGVEHALTKEFGENHRGHYIFDSSISTQNCEEYYYYFTNSAGRRWEYPAKGLLVLSGSSCTDNYKARTVSCNPQCSIHGECDALDTCWCEQGWIGDLCEIGDCSPSCLKGDCTGKDTCTCWPGWEGQICETPICTSPGCLNSGICIGPDICQCISSWTGDNCEIPICNPSCQHGACSAPNKCTCDSGWQGSTCSTPICSPSCGTHGTCIAPNVCSCEAGWGGNICQIENCYCQHGTCATEANPDEDYLGCSSCDVGWDGTLCHVPHCEISCNFGKCLAPTSTCECQAGWGGSECNIPSCDAIGGCNNGICILPGVCNCQSGYTGLYCNETECYGVPAADVKRVCNKNGVCIAPNICNCTNPLFHGDNCHHRVYPGIKCFSIESSDPSVCSHNGECYDEDKCRCDPGYIGNNCSIIPVCFGIDGYNNSVCSSNGICVNHDKCSCNPSSGGKDCSRGRPRSLLATDVLVPLISSITFGIIGVVCCLIIVATIVTIIVVNVKRGDSFEDFSDDDVDEEFSKKKQQKRKLKPKREEEMDEEEYDVDDEDENYAPPKYSPMKKYSPLKGGNNGFSPPPPRRRNNVPPPRIPKRSNTGGWNSGRRPPPTMTYV